MGVNPERISTYRSQVRGHRVQASELHQRNPEPRVRVEGSTMAVDSSFGSRSHAGQSRVQSSRVDIALTWWGRFGTLVLMVAVVVLVASIISGLDIAQTPTRWARITEFHATWIPEEGVVRNSFRIEKFSECQDITIEKTMRPVKDGVVQSQDPPIVLQGGLKSKLMRIKANTSPTVFDDAMPTPRHPTAGDYWVTFSAGCTNNEVTQRTELVSAKIEVQEN